MTAGAAPGDGKAPSPGSPRSRFYLADLRGEEFRETDLSGVRMRGVILEGADIDGAIYGLRVNGVEIAPLVEAELDRRHPERALLRDRSVPGLRAAHAAYAAMWEQTYERVAGMPPETVEVSVDDEYTFVQTLRHLVFCADGWLRWGAQARRDDDVFWPAGVAHTQYAPRSVELGIDPAAAPSYEDALAVRRARTREVGDFLADLTPERAAEPAEPPPWMDPSEPFTVGGCLSVVLSEEWEHHSFAVRDLDVIDGRARDEAPGDDDGLR
ncbi:DinB family protein [Myceligenerans sp. TRM 65318]|uniref:DinB family protein n=2 Tax=Myceligenerans pegani TaxID=2776917 RepID=A0ABR9MXL1_9MICO|nr:DinB family protein [Myceligenerans sp. TRM 65318]MBE3018395.1 DinB family protein [Myceligenerans sp. TRM 65318]